MDGIHWILCNSQITNIAMFRFSTLIKRITSLDHPLHAHLEGNRSPRDLNRGSYLE